MVTVTTTWLLILTIYATGGRGIATTTFVDESSCQEAATKIVAEVAQLKALCIPKYK